MPSSQLGDTRGAGGGCGGRPHTTSSACASGLAHSGSWWQTLSASHLYTPILNGLPEFRNRSLVEYKVAIGVIRGLGITVGGSFDYDSTVQGKNQRDGKFFLTLGYDF